MGLGLAGGYGAGGAADALTEIIKQKFLEMVQRRKLAQDDRSMDMQGQRDLVAAELGRGRLDVDRGQLGVQQGGLDLRGKELAEETRRFDIEQPIRGRLQMAQTDDIRSRPVREMAERDHATAMEGTRHRNTLGQISARGAQERQTLNERPQGNERIVQVEGPNGTPIWVRESEAVGKPAAQAARAVTGAERQVIAYFNRAKEADELANKFEKGVAEAGLGSQLQQQYAPNIMQTADQQSYRQAQRAFTEARLRKESGAAIPQGEYDTDARTYFAQPGDSPQVREQKRKARQTVLEGLKFAAGRAYDEFYGESGKNKSSGGDSDPLGIRGGSK